jgi:16S rRNA (guanine1207-N2)-methyltransferase
MNPITYLFETHARISGEVVSLNISDKWFLNDLPNLHVYHRDWSVLQILERHLKQAVVHDDVFPPSEPRFDVALVEIGKGREFTRMLMLAALHALKPDGILYVAGANKAGAKTAWKDLGEIVYTGTLGNKASHRIFSAQRPADLPRLPQPETRILTVHGEKYKVVTQPGVFSWEHLDEGTAFLLDNLPPIPDGARVLDAGCGTGIVGMVVQREYSPAHVTWADVDLLAVNCVRQSLPGADVRAVDLTQFDEHYNVVLCNPPFHREQDTTTEFMKKFVRQVSADTLAIVANSFLPYEKLLQERFKHVEKVADDGHFQVLHAEQ